MHQLTYQDNPNFSRKQAHTPHGFSPPPSSPTQTSHAKKHITRNFRMGNLNSTFIPSSALTLTGWETSYLAQCMAKYIPCLQWRRVAFLWAGRGCRASLLVSYWFLWTQMNTAYSLLEFPHCLSNSHKCTPGRGRTREKTLRLYWFVWRIYLHLIFQLISNYSQVVGCSNT